VIQRRVPIEEGDTTGSLYFNRLFPLGIETMIEAVDLIRAGKAPATTQDERLATYEPICRDEHAKVDFGKPAREVYNLIRGCDPQPGAFASVAGKRLRLYEAALEAAAPDASAGTIIDIDGSAMRIALSGATLAVKRVRLEPSPKKVAPNELGSDLVVGTRLE